MAPTPRLATEQSDRDAGGAQDEVQDPRAPNSSAAAMSEFEHSWHAGARAGLAGLFFEPLRESLIARSNFAHCLLGLSVPHDFCLGQDLLGARSQVSGK
jgi:hypothetical protein